MLVVYGEKFRELIINNNIMKTGFFEEAEGVKSMTRLLVFMLIAYAILISGSVGIVGLVKFYKSANGSLMDVVIAVGSLLTSISAFAATWKLVQKPMEKSETPKSSE
jgi:K+-transporting ATPase c subunit